MSFSHRASSRKLQKSSSRLSAGHSRQVVFLLSSSPNCGSLSRESTLSCPSVGEFLMQITPGICDCGGVFLPLERSVLGRIFRTFRECFTKFVDLDVSSRRRANFPFRASKLSVLLFLRGRGATVIIFDVLASTPCKINTLLSNVSGGRPSFF